MQTDSTKEKAVPDRSGRGILYVATGPDYVRAACASAESAANYSPLLKRHLFCDAGSAHVVPRGLFSSIAVIENPHRRSKIDQIPRTPFSRTLYLDADTEVVAPIEDLFELLDRFDIALAHAHLRNIPATRQLWKKRIPDSFPQMNAGVIAYRSRPPVLEFLQNWQVSFHEARFRKDQVTLRELLWKSDLRIAALPPEYNVRNARCLEGARSDKELKPRILHCRRLVPRKPRVTSFRGKIAGWPLRQGRLVRAVFGPLLRRLRELIIAG
jgi:hypothetical protein